ncbi:MAG: sugar phosphate isomerase/epimerase family protein [Candidatus Omnitrophota bacterium]
MKIGLNLLLWDGTITDKHIAVMEKLKEIGFDGVEFPIFSFDRAQAKRLRTHLDRLQLACTITSCVPKEANPISEDAAIRKAALNHMKKTIEIAQILGAETIAGPFTAPVGYIVGRPRTDDEWKWGLDVMRKVAAAAEKTGVMLALEALNRFETFFINTSADACQFADEVNHPNFNIMWDTFHANIEEESIPKAMKAAAKRIVHVHVSENHRGIPGAGHIRFGEVFKCLKEMKYDRWLTVEAFGSALPELAAATCIWRPLFADSYELAAKSLAFIKKQWG